MRAPRPSAAHSAAAPRRRSAAPLPQPLGVALRAWRAVARASFVPGDSCSRRTLCECMGSDQPQFPLPGRRQLRPATTQAREAVGRPGSALRRPPADLPSAASNKCALRPGSSNSGEGQLAARSQPDEPCETSPRMLRIYEALKIAPIADVQTCMHAAVMLPGTMGEHTEGVRAWAARLLRTSSSALSSPAVRPVAAPCASEPCAALTVRSPAAPSNGQPGACTGTRSSGGSCPAPLAEGAT